MSLQAFAFLSAVLVAALLLEPLAARLRLPFSAVLVIVGFAGSEAAVALGMDTGIRAQGFHDLIFYVFLPVLIFESALGMDRALLLRNLGPILLLAVPGMLLAVLVTAVLVYLGVGHPTGFPFTAALLTGVLLSATDPAAVIALFKRLGVPERLTVITEGESLFNDAVAIVLYGLVLAIALSPAQAPGPVQAVGEFLAVFGGGIVVGGLVGGAALLLRRRLQGDMRQGLLTIIAAYGAYLLAEGALHVSGVMAVLAAGLALGAPRDSAAERGGGSGFVSDLWELGAYSANAAVFLLMGATITLSMFQERWLAMLIAIGAVLVARTVVFPLLALTSRLVPGEPVPLAWRTVLYWGGVRGAVTLALALSLPVELDYWWTVQSIAFGVVLFTLFVQAPTAQPLARYYGLQSRGQST